MVGELIWKSAAAVLPLPLLLVAAQGAHQLAHKWTRLGVRGGGEVEPSRVEQTQPGLGRGVTDLRACSYALAARRPRRAQPVPQAFETRNRAMKASAPTATFR